MQDQVDPRSGVDADIENDLNRHRKLEQRTWRNWCLIVLLCVGTTIGLGAAILLSTDARMSTPWPWANTEAALIVGLALVVLAAAGYLTVQQRELLRVRRDLVFSQRQVAGRISRHFDRLVAILHVSRTMASATDLQEVFDAITRSCLETFECDQVSLMLLDRESQELVVTSAKGRHAVDDVLGARARVGEGVAGWVAEHQEPLILGEVVDARRYQSFRPKPNAPTASMIVPITARGELVGVLNVGNHAPGTRYVDEDVHALMVFAENAGICCRHAEQSEWMRQTIRRLDSELAARDRIRSERAA